MKKSLFLAATLALTLTSCHTVTQTASQRNVNTPIVGFNYAELDVSTEKVSYTLRPSKEVRAGGEQNCVNVAIHQALKGTDGDVLVETQEAIVTRKGLLKKKITSVTVTGYPAKYVNFESASKDELLELTKAGVISTSAPSKASKGGIMGIFKK